jgi:hypothetical protein
MRTRTRRAIAVLAVAAAFGLATTELAAQVTTTRYAPYYGKNRVKYDNFQWKIYTTDHFEIFYYPEIEQHLERVSGYAESAYQKISSDLKHDLAFKVPLVLFKTQSEFQQQNVLPGDVPEGVAAFAEPQRDRMVLPIDEPPDQLYRLITHELTHIFEFDIIPRSLIRRGVPLWIDEGFADYMAGVWRPLDLMTVRDAAVADALPKMTELEGYGNFNNPRLIYNLGHVAFEFIESKAGKEGIRQFLFALRKSVIGGGENAYEEALKMTPDEFDEQFDKYLKDRFKPFRDKERPADYGRNLAPKPEKTSYTAVFSIEPSPSGDLFAAIAGNRRDQELDVILISTKDGQVIRNLTSGFDKDKGFDYIAVPGARWNAVPWMSWSPTGDRLAYFARTSKQRSLVIQNVLTGKVEERIEIKEVDVPESPEFSPDGRTIAFSGLQNAIGDIWTVSLETGAVTNVTKDEFADYAPTFSPDGKMIVYISRISGNDKLFKVDLATGQKTQLTFGTHDDAAAHFFDADTIVFSSTATDPLKPVEPEVARNGNIYNLWTFNLTSGELRQYTDTLTGNLSPVVFKEGEAKRVAFVTYFKGDYGVHTIEPKEPIATAASADFGAPGPVIDFQAPLTHQIVEANQKKKGAFEKLFLDGRPPVALGVTSGGDLFGGTAISFSDVLGDRQFNFFAASVSQYRQFVGSYVDLARRFQFAINGFSQTFFYYALQPGYLYDPGLGFLDRDQAIAQQSYHGGSVFGIYPLSRYRRFELFGGVTYYKEEYDDPLLQFLAEDYQQQQYGQVIFRDGLATPLGAAFIQETTVFREFGPLAGNTLRLAYETSPSIGDNLSYQTVDGDARYYLRLGGTGLLALRFRGYKSWGETPGFFYFGGNSEMRGYDYQSFVGNEGWFGNAELRFPLIQAMATPIGILGGVRGAFFFNIGGAWYNNQPYTFWTNDTEVYRPIVDYEIDPVTGFPVPVYGPEFEISGFRLRDGRASYGLSLQTFALGFPIHFDWSWKTLFNEDWENLAFAYSGGSDEFRRSEFSVWIGYDF